jgi:hypothetical protein
MAVGYSLSEFLILGEKSLVGFVQIPVGGFDLRDVGDSCRYERPQSAVVIACGLEQQEIGGLTSIE